MERNETISVDLPDAAMQVQWPPAFDGIELERTRAGCRLTTDRATAHRLVVFCSEGGWSGTPTTTSFVLRVIARRLREALRELREDPLAEPSSSNNSNSAQH